MISKRTVATIILICVLLFLALNEGARNLVKRKIQEHKLRSELNEIKAENGRLRREINKMEHNERHIEYRIRRELGYTKKGEIEYRIKKQD